jgi:hypothetical protein
MNRAGKVGQVMEFGAIMGGTFVFQHVPNPVGGAVALLIAVGGPTLAFARYSADRASGLAAGLILSLACWSLVSLGLFVCGVRPSAASSDLILAIILLLAFLRNRVCQRDLSVPKSEGAT